ncbi:DUF4139 domain-containing protein [Streptomyces sp. SBST2-5]|uniref:DUF4139 domain-containing protein n=1 Tax=Streptomyces composti TaxID=2720025 RepID=A0ABX1A4U7_9ACTN|nr:DUF4139 domain-containing protein [Streptomyces composti]NJP49614.1 DUF4139 domain-containing protein [Streptomyces composti]
MAVEAGGGAWASALDSVVVYAQGALCRRRARGRVPAGGRVRVRGLPRSLDPGSLRARVVGAAGVRVTQARLEVEAEPAGPDPADALRREVERLSEERAAAKDRRDRQLARIGEVEALRPVPPPRGKDDDTHRRTPVDAWLELAGFVDERLTGLHARLVELEEELRRIEHELAIAVDRQVRASNDAPAAHVETAMCAVLTLDGTDGAQDAGDTGEVEIEVEYGVPGALWVPAYRLTHDRGDGEARLVLRASVAQRTGEDWTGVRIAFATADLRRRTDLPRLRSVRIGRSQPAPAPSGWREPPASLADLFAGYDSAGARDRAATGARETAVGAAAGPPVPPPAPMPVAAYGSPPPAPGGRASDGDEALDDLFEHEVEFGGLPSDGPDGAAPRARPRAAAAWARGGRGGRGGPGGPTSAPGARGRTATPPPRAAPAAPAAPGGYGAPAGYGAPPSAPGGSAAPPSAPPAVGPPRPSGEELDYSALVLSGPEEPEGRRGLLLPGAAVDPVTAEHRRRAEGVAALPLPGRAVPPRESAGSFDHRYDAAARADIPSDGTWHTVTVAEIPVGLRTEYVCVPSVEEAVYATLVLHNATDRALLAGPVEVTADGEYLATTSLPTLAPGGGCRVGLGPAEALAVTRRTSLRESAAGLRNNVTVLEHRVRVELANRLAQPVAVEVRERVPVTSEADIRIEERADWSAPEEAGSGAGAQRERQAEAGEHAPGTRLWRVTLPAGGTVTLDGGYDIRIPAGKALAGGNRRS